jgi:hypothetical protein
MIYALTKGAGGAAYRCGDCDGQREEPLTVAVVERGKREV